MEELVVYCLPYNKLKVICRDFPEFSIISRFFLEYHLYLAEETILMLKQRNAEAKYIFFLQHYPHLLYSISLHAIAGFPGITKETLSRVRSRMQKKKYSL